MMAETDTIRPCVATDHGAILAIINSAAEAYRDMIPADRWHDPYMSAHALTDEIAQGVVFSGYRIEDRLVGVMGVQRRHNVDLIRHAYVLPQWQGRAIGARLLDHLCRSAGRPILIGTWRAAQWAIRFYERNGFACVADDDIAPLLQTYWTIPERQIATSLVLARPPLQGEAARDLIAATLW